MNPSDTAERAESAPPLPSTPTVERLLRVAAAIADVPIAIAFAIDGDQARITASEGVRPSAVDPTVSARRLRLDRTRVVPHVGKGPAAPEVALFNPGTTVLSLVSMPIFDAGVQIGAILLADARPRTPLGERTLAALEDVRAMIEWAARPLVEEGPLEEGPLEEGPLADESARLAPRETTSVAVIAPAPEVPAASMTRRRSRSSQIAPRPDPVTGVPDRGYVQKDTERRIERASALNHGMAFVIVSLDRFRRVNDSLGHTLGDQLLRQVAQRLLSSVDEVDLVGRRTGDEFIVVIDELGPHRSVMPAVDRIQQSIREPFHVDGHEIVLSACLGMSRYPQDATDAASLLRYSDIALHQAKDEGPGRLKLFDASMQTLARERLDLEHQLREAMRTSQLQMFYQPKYAIGREPASRGALVGAEALMRWSHPQRGMISPARFIPVAEDSGLIVPIGTWALNEVCRQTKRWSDAGIDVGRVSVNVSGLQFTRHDFVGTVTRALRAASLPPRALELELTETIVMQDVEKAIARLGQIRGLGVRVSVDDFGTGYSSLAYLQKLPVDVLKIDRSFVQELDRDGLPAQQARSLAQAITYLGHQLGLEVLAEGVETHAQLEQLAHVGCDEVQGYLFGKPMPADAFERHVRDA